jgi:hypothetical protein
MEDEEMDIKSINLTSLATSPPPIVNQNDQFEKPYLTDISPKPLLIPRDKNTFLNILAPTKVLAGYSTRETDALKYGSS